MNPKFFILISICISLLFPALSSHADEMAEESIVCYDQTDVPINEELEAFKANLQDITKDLEEMTPEEIIRIFTTLKIPENPLYRATKYYDQQYRALNDGFLMLSESHFKCDAFYSMILDSLKIDQKSCHNAEIEDQSRLDNLNVYHSGLLASTLVLQKVLNGATLEELFNEAMVILERPTDARTPDSEPSLQAETVTTEENNTAFVEEPKSVLDECYNEVVTLFDEIAKEGKTLLIDEEFETDLKAFYNGVTTLFDEPNNEISTSEVASSWI